MRLTFVTFFLRQIGDRLGPFDVAALPIGAYAPSYFMNVSHVHPTEAVRIHQDLHATRSVAIHWGSFSLSEEAYDEPPRLLAEASREAGVDFIAVPQGSFIVGPSATEEDGQHTVVETNSAEEDQEDDIAFG